MEILNTDVRKALLFFGFGNDTACGADLESVNKQSNQRTKRLCHDNEGRSRKPLGPHSLA
jgi:hypothetical protein